MLTNRRSFLKNTATNILGLAAVPAILSMTIPESGKRKSGISRLLKENDTILFQGDSITDAGRNRENTSANNLSALGSGYALFAASGLLTKFPGKNLQIYNRGLGGDRVDRLTKRWEKDCIDLKPALVSILIGTNDFWHVEKHGYDGTVEKYENEYRDLLKLTLRHLPNVKIVICEPFAITGGFRITYQWYPAYRAYQIAAKNIAAEFQAFFVPFQSVFDEALKYAPLTYWIPDGIHPSAMTGSPLMAQAWLKAIS